MKARYKPDVHLVSLIPIKIIYLLDFDSLKMKVYLVHPIVIEIVTHSTRKIPLSKLKTDR